MKTNLYFLFLGLLLLAMLTQKGMPPKEQTRVQHETHYKVSSDDKASVVKSDLFKTEGAGLNGS